MVASSNSLLRSRNPRRECSPSLLKTLPRWYSTVFKLTHKLAPTSLVIPVASRAATSRSRSVSVNRRWSTGAPFARAAVEDRLDKRSQGLGVQDAQLLMGYTKLPHRLTSLSGLIEGLAVAG